MSLGSQLIMGYLDRYWKDQDRADATRAQNANTNQRSQFFGDLVGSRGQAAIPSNAVSSANPALNMQPIMQNQSGQWIDNPDFQYAKPKVEGSGYLGGPMDQSAKIAMMAKMMGSKFPTLQSAGAKSFGDLMKPGAKAKGETPTTLMKNLSAMGLEQGSPEYNSAIANYLKKPGGSTINVNTANPFVKPSDVIRDAEGNYIPTPIGTRLQDLTGKGYTYGKPLSDTAIKTKASMEVSSRMLNEIQSMSDAGTDVSGIKGFISELRTGTDIGSVAANAILNELDQPMTPEHAKMVATTTSLGNQLLQAFRGAAVGPAEKIDFIKQLPTPGQPRAVFLKNIELTRRNLQQLADVTEGESRGIRRPEPKPTTESMPDYDSMSDEEITRLYKESIGK